MSPRPRPRTFVLAAALVAVAVAAAPLQATDVIATTHNAAEGTYGLRVTLDAQQPGYVQDDSPAVESVYRARFWFMPRQEVDDAQGLSIFEGYDSGGTPILRLYFVCESRPGDGCSRRVRALTRNDSGTWVGTKKVTIGSVDPWQLEIEVTAASGPGTNDGCLVLRRLDGTNPGVRVVSLCGIDNDTKRVETARMGAVNNIDPVSDGNLFFDSFASFRTTGSP